MRAAVGVALLVALGCARSWDVDAFAARHPQLRELGANRLGDLTPYLLPVRGRLVYFLCRWPDRAEIPVSLPPDASDAERIDMRLVLQAWEDAGLGLRFVEADTSDGRGIEIRFAEDEFPEGWVRRAANAVADCAVDADAPDAPVLDAQIRFASIHASRMGRDAIGRDVPWSRDERIGALLHEMGHALGFQGHERRGDGVMVASTDHVRRAARRVIAGEPLRDTALRALYAVPSGSVVRRARVEASRTQPVDRMLRVAAERGLRGPFAQVGDEAARIVWRDAYGAAYAVTIWNLEDVLRSPGALRIFPEPRAAELLRSAR